MNRPRRSTASGRAYLDLHRLARTSGRSMQTLLPMFASERWLTRLAVSDHRNRFVLKGGVLLAALGNRRPTQDADLLARGISNDHDTVIGYINEIASIDLHDGMAFDPTTTVAATIRESDLYLGVRLSMDCALATAKIRQHPEHRTAALEDSCRLLWQSLPHDDLAVEGAAHPGKRSGALPES